MDIHAKLHELGYTLPTAPKPVAAYVPSVQAGDLVFISGQLAFKEGQLLAVGSVPSHVTVEQAYEAARQSVLNALAVLDSHIDQDWQRLVQIVKIGLFVASDPGFPDQPKVANGASELLGQLFGEIGLHARSAVGVIALPLGSTVELELIAQVR